MGTIGVEGLRYPGIPQFKANGPKLPKSPKIVVKITCVRLSAFFIGEKFLTVTPTKPPRSLVPPASGHSCASESYMLSHSSDLQRHNKTNKNIWKSEDFEAHRLIPFQVSRDDWAPSTFRKRQGRMFFFPEKSRSFKIKQFFVLFIGECFITHNTHFSHDFFFEKVVCWKLEQGRLQEISIQ